MSIAGRRNVVCVIWVLVGILLFWRGLPYAGLVEDPEIVGLSGSNTWIALAAAVVVGIGKGMSALKKAGRRAVTRMHAMGDQAPVWTIFGWTMYLLVGLMIGAGLLIRTADYDPNVKAWIVGILYPGIGVALLIGGLLVRNAEPLPPKDEPAPAAGG